MVLVPLLPLWGLNVAMADDALVMSTSANEKYNMQSAWSLPVNFEAASGIYSPGTYERQAQESIALMPSYRLTGTWKLNAMIFMFKDESGSGPDNTGFDNTSVSLTSVQVLNSSVYWLSSFTGILPTNQQLRDDTSYEGTARAATGLMFDNLLGGSSLRYMVSVERNIHGYTQAADGSYNLRDDLGQNLDFAVPLGRKFLIDMNFGYVVAQTYLDDLRTRFSAEVDLIWMVNRRWSVSIGTSNEGDALKPNGVDSNVALFDNTSSVIKFDLTYTL